MKLAYVATLLIAALAVAIIVSLAVASQHNPGIELLSLSSPSVAREGEVYSIYGGLWLPEGRYEKRFRYCGRAGCKTHGWGTVTGPGEWWGFHGNFDAADTGPHQAELILYERNSVGAWRAVASHSWIIDVH